METGHIYIPKLPALSIGKLAEYTVGEVEMERIPVRPGEKTHETLVTEEELDFVEDLPGYFNLAPTTESRIPNYTKLIYSSDNARQLNKEQLIGLLHD